jgi:hypothetical protein
MTISVEFDAEKRSKDGLALMTVSGPGLKSVELDLPFKELYRSLGSPHPVALDFLVIAGACYVIDKAVPRRSTADAWTRRLDVSRVGGGALSRWPPSAAQTACADFPRAAFTKT